MNAAIASASLLGFGDKPASEAMSSFAKTLEKMYSDQEKEHKKEDTTRRSTIEKYNEQQREKKKKQSDFQGFLSKLRGDGEGEGEGKKKKKGGLGLLGILGIAAVGGVAATVLAPMIVGKIGEVLFSGMKDKLDDTVEGIVDAIEAPVKEKFEEIKEGWNGIVSFVKEKLGIEEEEEEPEMASFGENYKEQELALAKAAEESRNKTPAEEVAEAMTPPPTPDKQESTPAAEVSEAVQPSAPQEGGNTAWDPVLEMISSAESRGRYDIMYGGEIVDGITEMTIAEAAKRAGDRGDGKNYAVGKYQFITLVKQAEAAGLNPNKDLFSPKNQDKIAIDLITRKRKITVEMAKKNPKEAGKRLAMEWAGLPVLAPTKGYKRDIQRGQSYYAGDGVNKSTITPEQVEGSFQKLQKGGEVKAPKDKNDPRTKLGVMENRKFEVKSPVLQGKEAIQKRQKGGLVLFAGHQDVPIGHSQPGTDAPGTPLEGKYKPTAEQHFAHEVGVATQALAQQKNVPISYRPAKGRYASTSNPNSNWAQITQIRNQGGSAIDLHFDAYGYDRGKLIVGSRGVISNGFNLTNIEKEIQNKFGSHSTGATFQVPILELDPINKAPGNSQTYAQMIVSSVQKAAGGSTTETTTESTTEATTETTTETTTEGTTEATTETTTEKVTEVPQGRAGAARGANPPSLTVKPKKEETKEEEEEEKNESNAKGVQAVLKSAEENVGIGAGQSMQCANTTRQVLRAAGHPDANKTTKRGDLDPEGLKYSGASFAASFAGTDMGQIKKSVGSLEAGDIVLWKNTFSAMGGSKPGAITHVGIKGQGNDVYHHGSGPGWRKTAMFDGGKFAYGVNLSGTGGATGVASEDLGNNDLANVTGSITDVTSALGAVSTGNPLDDALNQIVGELLAPIFGALGAAFGKPLKNDTTSEGESSSGGASQISSGGGGGGVPSGNGGTGAASTKDPNARALLNAIADAEGTTKYANNGYNTMFTGKQFKSLKDHPRQVQGGSSLRSDAAGRYQFLSTTWDEYANGRDMSPANQDAVALELVAKKRRVDISDGLSKEEIYRLGQEWASIEGGPQGVPGGSYGGQAKFSADKFMSMYKNYGGKVQGLQQGGMVGQQINTGSMRGAQNERMAKIKQISERMKKKGPKLIRVTAPTPPPQQAPIQAPPESSGGGGFGGRNEMKASTFADYSYRISMGATG